MLLMGLSRMSGVMDSKLLHPGKACVVDMYQRRWMLIKMFHMADYRASDCGLWQSLQEKHANSASRLVECNGNNNKTTNKVIPTISQMQKEAAAEVSSALETRGPGAAPHSTGYAVSRLGSTIRASQNVLPPHSNSTMGTLRLSEHLAIMDLGTAVSLSAQPSLATADVLASIAVIPASTAAVTSVMDLSSQPLFSMTLGQCVANQPVSVRAKYTPPFFLIHVWPLTITVSLFVGEERSDISQPCCANSEAADDGFAFNNWQQFSERHVSSR